ncbi:hypothetical protein [Vibrio harveyi]|uniref:hypothetical protein n=1 Tax=Vibrio harveyi TaxID=669 RepID=UPI003CFB119D
MSTILKDIKNIVDNAGSVITSGNIKNVASAATKVLLVAAVSASVIQSNNAFACGDHAHHVHSVYSTVAGESRLVRDHVENTLDLTGVSINQHSDYLNYEHPVQSKINEFIKHAHDNYSQAKFEEVSELAEVAQSHFDNGLYQGVDQYATFLTPLMDKHVTLFEHHNNVVDFDTKLERAQAVVDIVEMMGDDPSFNLDYNIGSIPQVELDSNQSHISREVGNMNVVITNPIDSSSQINGFFNTAWAMNGNDMDDIHEYLELSREPFRDAYINAYGLTDHDISLLDNRTISHEVAHLFGNSSMDISTSEFMAEAGATWNGIKSGGSEGYFQFMQDSGESAYGVINKKDSHDSIAMLGTFFSQHSYEEWKDMSIDDFRKEMYSFSEMVVENTNDGFGEVAHLIANEKIKENGTFPTVQEYLRATGEHPEVLEVLEGAKEVAKENIDIQLINAKAKVLLDPDSSFIDRLMANNFPEMLVGERGINPDEDIKRIKYSQMAEEIDGSNGYFNTSFDISEYETEFDKASDPKFEYGNVKVMDDHTLVRGDDGFTSIVYKTIEAEVQHLSNGHISYDFYPEYADYNQVNFDISPDGDVIKTVNGVEVEITPDEIDNIHMSGVDSLAYILKSIESNSPADSLDADSSMYGDLAHNVIDEEPTRIDRDEMSRNQSVDDDYGYSM